MLVGDLAHALQDPNRRVRRNAAQTLGSLGADAAGAAEALVDAGADRSGSVRRPAVWALGWIAAEAGLSPDVVARLGQVVLQNGDQECRRLAAVALSHLGEGARPALGALRQTIDALRVGSRVRGRLVVSGRKKDVV